MELVISVRKRNPIVCHSQGASLYAAIDVALDKAESQLTRFKERLKKHHHRNDRSSNVAPAPLQAELIGDDEEGLESYEDIVDKTDFSG